MAKILPKLMFCPPHVRFDRMQTEKELRCELISSDTLLEAKNRCHAVDRVSSISISVAVGPVRSSTDRFVGHLAAVTLPSATIAPAPSHVLRIAEGISCQKREGGKDVR